MLILCVASALVPIRLPAQPADRFWWNWWINDKPVRFALDSGCPDLCLWRSAADRLGLKLSPVELDSNNVAPWETGEFKLGLSHWQRRLGFPVTLCAPARAWVVETPVSLGVDGCVGWPAISRRITRFDAMSGNFEFLAKVPKQVKDWSQFTIRTNSDILVLELPGGDGTHSGLHIDTGGDDGFFLSALLWDQWMAAHPNESRKIGFRVQMDGLIPFEGTRASGFSIGGLTMTNIGLDRFEEHDCPVPLKGCAAVISFGVLKRFDLVVDGQHALAYLGPSKKWKPFMAENQKSLHGHSGALFGPWRNQTNCFAAYVISASPAFESGIRDGDILLKVDGKEVKQWQDNPGKAWSSDLDEYGCQETYSSRNSPASTMLQLTLRRRDQVFQATVLQSQIAVLALRKIK
jgi:hypothetical protein